MKKGFTLVEMIATIAILSIIILISAPSVLKSYNESRIKAMVIQETKLVEAGDILLDDYCNDALDESKKEKCSEYYQRLYSVSNLKDEVNYNYICVRDLKNLKYYSEKLVYGGSNCQGVVVYETDKKTNLKVDSYSYIDCEGAYTSQNADNIDFMNLFKECFDSNITEEEENKIYTITIKYVEDNLYGKQIRNNKVIKVDSETYKKDVKGTFNIIKHTKYGNNYGHAINHPEGVDVEYVSTDSEGTMTYNITKMPKQDITINVVYSVLKYDIVTNYYFYDNNTNLHSGKSIKESKSVTGYTFETVKLDVPETLTSKVNGKDELFNLKFKKVDGVNVNSDISKDEMDIGTANKIVDYIYQRDEFDIIYDTRGGSSCTNGRVKYEGYFGELCEPVKVGYTFKGWKKNLSDTDYVIKGSQYTDYSDARLIADWEVHKYTLVFNSNNALGNTASITCLYDQNCILPSNGYNKFCNDYTGWYLNTSSSGTKFSQGENIKQYIKDHITEYPAKNETINLYAGWLAKTHIVTFDANGGTVASSSKSVKYMTNFGDLPTATRNGYDFIGWYNSYATRDNTKPYRNNPWLFYSDKYDDLYNAYGYDQEKLSNHYKQYGQSEGREKAQFTSSTAKTTCANETISAGWYPIKYTITYNLNGGTNPSGAVGRYNVETDTFNLPTPTKSGNQFLGWYTNSSFTGSVVSKISKGSTGNKTYYAKWKELSSLPDFEYTGSFELVMDDATVIASGTNKRVVIPEEYKGYNDDWKLRLLSTGNLTIYDSPLGANFDVFLVGGGSAGGACSGAWMGDHGGDGGSGGYTRTKLNYTLDLNYEYNVVIGNGGQSTGNAGENTSAFGLIAAGGKVSAGGSDGGSGGNFWGTNRCSNGGNGSSDGNGTNGQRNVAGPNGETGSTREFGETTGELYAGGGGGGHANGSANASCDSSSGKAGAGGGGVTSGKASESRGMPNTGGGGGGCASGGGKPAGKGGSGIVIIRNKR